MLYVVVAADSMAWTWANGRKVSNKGSCGAARVTIPTDNANACAVGAA